VGIIKELVEIWPNEVCDTSCASINKKRKEKKKKKKNNNQKLKEKKKKRNINIDLAILPSHDTPLTNIIVIFIAVG